MITEIGDLDFTISIDREEMTMGLLFHELSHVLFYFDQGYKEQVTSLWNQLDEGTKQEMAERLKRNGYEDLEIIDEWFAHLFWGFADKNVLMETNPPLSAYFQRIENEFSNLDWS